ncbi:hypothetical protein PVAG01_04855 [Phlyctema vagabunda]|uniref:Uncharacterized protein n=1 Tax=Phlyctema vagabunda TaxID=108571 RepID=A0ABR4PIF7_9HELO
MAPSDPWTLTSVMPSQKVVLLILVYGSLGLYAFLFLVLMLTFLAFCVAYVLLETFRWAMRSPPPPPPAPQHGVAGMPSDRDFQDVDPAVAAYVVPYRARQRQRQWRIRAQKQRPRLTARRAA